jgi:hypothetical protein
MNTEKIEEGKIYECENRFNGDPYSTGAFIPVYVGEIGEEHGQDIIFTQGRCFDNIQFSFVTPQENAASDELTIKINISGSKSFFCHDWFFFGGVGLSHVDEFFFEGEHEITFKGLSKEAKTDIRKNGL